MGNTPDPMEPLKILGQRIVETMTAMGLQVENFAFLPNLGDGPNFAQIVVSLNPEALSGMVEDEQQRQADDDILAGLEQQMKKDKEKEKEEEAREGLLRLQQQLEEGENKGILPEGDS